jgi:hypothetical protein
VPLGIKRLPDFVLTWLDLKDLRDDGGRCGRASGLDPRHRDKTSKDVF